MKSISRIMLISIILFTFVYPDPDVSPAFNGSNEISSPPLIQEELPILPQTIPSPPAGGPRPTIEVNPDHAYLGQSITINGQAAEGYPGVRISWLVDGGSQTADIEQADASMAYTSSLTIPDDFPPGLYQVCASATEAELAELACTPFTIDVAPPGSISGSIPLNPTTKIASIFSGISGTNPNALVANALLRTLSGSQVASVPIQADGTFQLSLIPPGSYTLSISGVTPLPISGAEVLVSPAQDTLLDEFQIPELYSCADKPLESVSVVSNLASSLNRLNLPREGIGLYVRNGPELFVTFTAEFNGNISAIESVDFYYDPEVGDQKPIGSDTDGSPWQIDYDVSLLQEQGQGFKRGKLIARPNVPSDKCAESDSIYINSISNPLDVDYLDGELTWNVSTQKYVIEGYFEESDDLHVFYPDPPPEILYKTYSNSIYGNVVRFVGDLGLDGSVHLQFIRLKREVTLLNFPFLSEEADLMNDFTMIGPSSSLEERIGTEAFFTFGQRDDISIDVPVFSMSFGIPYIAELRFSIAIGLQGGLRYQGLLSPWLGELDAWLYPSVGPHMTFTVEITLLLFFSGGADLTGSLDIIVPISTNNTRTPRVEINDPCFYWLLSAEVYVSAFWQRTTVWEGDIVDYESEPGCSGFSENQTASPVTETLRTRWMVSPEIASAPDGRMLSVYVDDVTPEEVTPTLKVMASFWDSELGNWGVPQPLSDGIHMVHDPTVAYLGSTPMAMVAWSQNTLETPGFDIKYAVNHTEIYYAVWDGSTWGSPQRLTDDDFPDGYPVLSGSDYRMTIAYVHDWDANFTTRTDWRIYFNFWDPDEQSFKGPPYPYVVYGGGDGMYAQPSLVEESTVGLSRFTIVYTADVDGDLSTTQDRNIGRYTCAGYTCWVGTLPVPAGSDSPSLGGLNGPVTFLVNTNGDQYPAGFGTLSEVWIASDIFGTQVRPVLDSSGEKVYGESPRLVGQADGTITLLFRRFGEPSSLSGLGQIYRADVTLANTTNILPVTQDNDMHWQPAFAYTESTLVALNVRQPIDLPQQTLDSLPSNTITPAFSTTLLSSGDNLLESIVIPNKPDLALAPQLELSIAHALPGSSVEVTAMVTNLGRAFADYPVLDLYANDPISGTFLGRDIYLDLLNPGETWYPNVTITAGSGTQPIYAVVSMLGSEITTDNNQAYAELGEIPAPDQLQVNFLEGALPAILLSWSPSEAEGIAGYRVLRSSWPSTSFELVGETVHNYFTDWPIVRNQDYAYKIQAFDAAGVRSSYSPVSFGFYPRVTIEKSVEAIEPVNIGDVVTYTLELSNTGETAALNLYMTDTLPTEIDFGGWIVQNGAEYQNGVITWNGDLPGEMTLIFTSTVDIDPSIYGQTITNTVTFTSDNAGDGSAIVEFTLVEAPLHMIYLPTVRND